MFNLHLPPIAIPVIDQVDKGLETTPSIILPITRLSLPRSPPAQQLHQHRTPEHTAGKTQGQTALDTIEPEQYGYPNANKVVPSPWVVMDAQLLLDQLLVELQLLEGHFLDLFRVGEGGEEAEGAKKAEGYEEGGGWAHVWLWDEMVIDDVISMLY